MGVSGSWVIHCSSAEITLWHTEDIRNLRRERRYKNTVQFREQSVSESSRLASLSSAIYLFILVSCASYVCAFNLCFHFSNKGLCSCLFRKLLYSWSWGEVLQSGSSLSGLCSALYNALHRVTEGNFHLNMVRWSNLEECQNAQFNLEWTRWLVK